MFSVPAASNIGKECLGAGHSGAAGVSHVHGARKIEQHEHVATDPADERGTLPDLGARSRHNQTGERREPECVAGGAAPAIGNNREWGQQLRPAETDQRGLPLVLGPQGEDRAGGYQQQEQQQQRVGKAHMLTAPCAGGRDREPARPKGAGGRA